MGRELSPITPWARTTAVGLMFGFLLAWPARFAGANSPFSAFQGLSSATLDSVQIKITPILPTNVTGLSALVLRGPHSGPVEDFHPYRSPDIDYYYEDHVPLESLEISFDEIRAMINEVATISSLTDGLAQHPAAVSFAIARPAPGGGTLVFENISAREHDQAYRLFEALRTALPDNHAAQDLLNRTGWPLDAEDKRIPRTVPAHQAHVTLGAPTQARGTGHFVAVVTVRNTASRTLPGPLLLGIGFSVGGIRLANASGPCRKLPCLQYIDIPIEALAPDDTASVTLIFYNPQRRDFTPDLQLYSGAGMR